MRKVLVVQLAEAELVYRANEVVEQLLQEERIRPIKEANCCLVEDVAQIEDLVDNIVPRGKPAGSCFLYPQDSRL